MKIKSYVSVFCAAALALSLSACGTESMKETATPTVTANQTVQTAQSSGYSVEGAVELTFSDGGIAVADGAAGCEVDGTALTISGAGTYIISGSCSDGSVTVKKGATGVTLVLDGLSLTSADTAPITCGKSSEVTIIAAQGTESFLADSELNNDEEHAENTAAENAVIKCKDGSDVVLCGSGSINITANAKNGIKSGASTDTEGEASLTIRELTLNISAPVNDAVNAEQLLNIESGSLNISAGDDALHCDLVMNVGSDGTDGPSITISDCYEGLEAAELNVFSGDIFINSSDDCLNAANSDLSGYDFSMNIYGGSIVAFSSSGDGFDSNGSLTISGGSVVVWTANTADNQPLDADGEISMTGGTVLAAGGSAGMGMRLTDGQCYVTFGSEGGFGNFGGFGGRPGDTDGDFGDRPELPDGVEAGERPEMPENGSFGDIPTPPDGAEAGDRPEMPENGGFPGSGGNMIISEGSEISITAADGSVLYSGSAPCGASFVFFSSPDIESGASITLTSGDTTLTSEAQ